MTNDESHWTPLRLPCENPLTNELQLFYNFQAAQILVISNGSLILLLFVLSIATKRSNLLLSNGGPIVDYVTSKMCLPKQMVIFRHKIIFAESDWG
jgi:hypothetical protein